MYHGGGVLGVDGKGDLAEIMFYDEVLSAEEENAVGYALAKKWGLPTDQPVVRAAVPGREIARLEAAPDPEVLVQRVLCVHQSARRRDRPVAGGSRHDVAWRVGEACSKGTMRPAVRSPAEAEVGWWIAMMPLGSFQIVLPETQGRRVEFFAEVRAPKSKATWTSASPFRTTGKRISSSATRSRFAKGTIRDYMEEFSLAERPVDEIFPIFGWLWPGPETLESSTMREMALSPNITADRLIAEYALANFSLGTHGAAPFGLLVAAGISPDDERLVEVTKDPMFWGFEGGDEPGEDRFPELGQINARIQRLAPGATTG